MNKKIVIKVYNNISKFLDKCINKKIELLNVKYIDKDTIIVTIYKDDLNDIKKFNYYSDVVIFKRLGFDKLILFFKSNLLNFACVFFCFFMMNFLENVIVSIDVIHSNKEIVELVKKELEQKNIRIFSMAKNFDELEKIRLDIIDDNPKSLEWMSITRVGMKYIVRVEERILTDIKSESGYCHVVAKKNGLVKNIKSSSGEIISRVNDYVREGDILISGEIHLYEEVKDNVCASGDVYAEVWYEVNLSIPLEYQEKEYTGNIRYNFILNNKKLFKNKYEFYDDKDIYKLKVWSNNFKYIKELEYKNILKKYSVDEAIEVAMKKVDNNFKIKLKNEGEIVSKKILKKTEFNSRIDIEVFVVTLENIAMQKNYSIEGDNIDSE